MKYIRTAVLMLWLALGIGEATFANEPDSVYLVSYTTLPDKGRSGLRFAWSADGKNWNSRDDGFGKYEQDKQIIDLVRSKISIEPVKMEFDE